MSANYSNLDFLKFWIATEPFQSSNLRVSHSVDPSKHAINRSFHSSIFCSAAVRCQQTIWPTANQFGIQIELSNSLSEGSTSQTSDLVEQLAQAEISDTSPNLCSHGDVISELIRSLTLKGMSTPKRKGFAKASVWELSFSNGTIESGLYHDSHFR